MELTAAGEISNINFLLRDYKGNSQPEAKYPKYQLRKYKGHLPPEAESFKIQIFTKGIQQQFTAGGDENPKSQHLTKEIRRKLTAGGEIFKV